MLHSANTLVSVEMHTNDIFISQRKEKRIAVYYHMTAAQSQPLVRRVHMNAYWFLPLCEDA